MVKFMKLWDRFGVWFLFILIVILFTIITPNFLTIDTFTNVIRQGCILGVCSLGYAMLRFVGLTNLSCGSIIGLCAVTGCRLMIAGYSPVLAVLCMLAIATVLSLFDGIMCEVLHLNAFVFTIATQSLWRGVALYLAGGKTIFGMPDRFAVIGQSILFGFLPSMILILAVCLIVSYIIMNKLYFGRYLYAVGGNFQAAVLSGIDTKKVKILTYIMAGLLFGISSVMLLSRNMVAVGNMATGYEFSAMTACVLGGISLVGGSGKIQNVLVGVFLLGTMSVGLNMLSINSWTEVLVKGLLLIFSFAMDFLRTKANAKMLVSGKTEEA